MPFCWASSSKSCLQYKVRAHHIWLSRKADRDIVDIVFCDRFICPKSPLMRRYFHEQNENSFIDILICYISVKTWMKILRYISEIVWLLSALLAQLTAKLILLIAVYPRLSLLHILRLLLMRKLLSHVELAYINLMISLQAQHTLRVCVMKICLLYVGTRQNFTDCRHLIGLLIYTTSRGAGWEILVGIWQNCIILLFLFSFVLRTLCRSIAIVCRAVEGHVCKSLAHKLQWMLIERGGRLLANGYGLQ